MRALTPLRALLVVCLLGQVKAKKPASDTETCEEPQSTAIVTITTDVTLTASTVLATATATGGQKTYPPTSVTITIDSWNHKGGSGGGSPVQSLDVEPLPWETLSNSDLSPSASASGDNSNSATASNEGGDSYRHAAPHPSPNSGQGSGGQNSNPGSDSGDNAGPCHNDSGSSSGNGSSGSQNKGQGSTCTSTFTSTGTILHATPGSSQPNGASSVIQTGLIPIPTVDTTRPGAWGPNNPWNRPGSPWNPCQSSSGSGSGSSSGNAADCEDGLGNGGGTGQQSGCGNGAGPPFDPNPASSGAGGTPTWPFGNAYPGPKGPLTTVTFVFPQATPNGPLAGGWNPSSCSGPWGGSDDLDGGSFATVTVPSTVLVSVPFPPPTGGSGNGANGNGPWDPNWQGSGNGWNGAGNGITGTAGIPSPTGSSTLPPGYEDSTANESPTLPRPDNQDSPNTQGVPSNNESGPVGSSRPGVSVTAIIPPNADTAANAGPVGVTPDVTATFNFPRTPAKRTVRGRRLRYRFQNATSNLPPPIDVPGPTKPPGFPNEATETTKGPGTGDGSTIFGVPPTSATATSSEFPRSSDFRQTSDFPSSSWFSETTTFPVTSEFRGSSEMPEPSRSPEMSKFPPMSNFSETTLMKETSEFPDTSSVPETSEFRETSSVPETTWMPETSQAASPTTHAPTSHTSSAPEEFCTGSSDVGNMTIDFEDREPGQLWNPYRKFWFSSGFIVQHGAEAPYNASSGDQLVEFVAASLSDGRFNNTHDLAMIGMARTSSFPCFRWNLYDLSLGCSSNTTNQDCHFEIWGLRYNEATGREEFMGASQDVMTLPCVQPRCQLTLKTFEGYENLSSIIIRVKSDSKIRLWWADDLRVGWTDNTCDAAWCRAWGMEQIAAKRPKVQQDTRVGELYLFTSKGIQHIRHVHHRRGLRK